jgi:large subunit ribosomal protein L13
VKTYSPKAKEIVRAWHVLDAGERPLGRLAAQAAHLLRGKHKPTFAPHLDVGDYVVVVNAANVRVTGRKPEQKIYRRHSGYPGGEREVLLKDLLATHPTRVVERAIKGMLPHNALGRQMYRKLRVYAGQDHPHGGQVAPPAHTEGEA